MLVIDSECWLKRKALDRILYWLNERTKNLVYKQGKIIIIFYFYYDYYIMIIIIMIIIILILNTAIFFTFY